MTEPKDPTVQALLTELRETKAERDAARVALEPLARAYEFWSLSDGGVHDDVEMDDQGKITFGDLKRAREALRSLKGSGGEGNGRSVAESGGTASPKSDGLCKSDKDVFLDICDRLQDDGDRVYLGSSNDAEALRALGRRAWSEIAGAAS